MLARSRSPKMHCIRLFFAKRKGQMTANHELRTVNRELQTENRELRNAKRGSTSWPTVANTSCCGNVAKTARTCRNDFANSPRARHRSAPVAAKSQKRRAPVAATSQAWRAPVMAHTGIAPLSHRTFPIRRRDNPPSLAQSGTTRIIMRFKARDSMCISCLWLPHETSKVISCGWDGTSSEYLLPTFNIMHKCMCYYSEIQKGKITEDILDTSSMSTRFGIVYRWSLFLSWDHLIHRLFHWCCL